jgi:hypothetical protein
MKKVTKKVCSIILSVVLLVSLFSFPAHADTFGEFNAEVNAFVTKTPGKTNILTITVSDLFGNYAAEHVIENNSDGYFDIFGYKVYINTYGNDKIRQCYIVSYDPLDPLAVNIRLKTYSYGPWFGGNTYYYNNKISYDRANAISYFASGLTGAGVGIYFNNAFVGAVAAGCVDWAIDKYKANCYPLTTSGNVKKDYREVYFYGTKDFAYFETRYATEAYDTSKSNSYIGTDYRSVLALSPM